MDTLVHWKKKRDKYDDETDGDFEDARHPKLVDTIQEPELIKRDETNANSLRILKQGGKKKAKWW